MLQELWNGKFGMIACSKCGRIVGHECKGGDLCSRCCTDGSHDHCERPGCGHEVECEDSRLCNMHCKCHTNPEGHCATPGCYYRPHCGEFCRSCCTEFHPFGFDVDFDDVCLKTMKYPNYAAIIHAHSRMHCIMPGCMFHPHCGVFCDKCCGSLEHDHCPATGCRKPNPGNGDICCSKVDDRKVCQAERCDNTPTCADDSCVEHCTKKNCENNHCSVFGCCGLNRGESVCYLHNLQDGSCSVKECFMAKTCDKVCYHHCTNRGCDHCDTFDCGGHHHGGNIHVIGARDCEHCSP